MLKVLVIFGSKSDNEVFDKIIKELKHNKVEYEFEVASAHRNPDKVHELAEKDHSVIIAGAGLSAALPGVLASKTIRPIIGIPCGGNYQGLDAFLSISQMPKGVPVLAVGVSQAEIAAHNAINMLKEYDSVSIIGNQNDKPVKDAVEILRRMDVPHKYATEPSEASVNLEFVYFDEPVEKKNQLIIYCPLLLKHDDRPEAALNLLKHSNHGLWVGLNNGVNAALAAVEILNINNKYEEALTKYREEMSQK